MRSTHYDVIVAGTGSMGAAALYYLAAAGQRTLGLEQSTHIPHENGSHTGQSRIIRKAYFEHPAYIPLLQRAYTNWRKLEERTGEQLYHPCGLIYTGPSTHPVIRSVKAAAAAYNIPLQTVQASHQLDAFPLHKNEEIFLEPDAGFLLPEKSIRVFLEEAMKHDAELRTGEALLRFEKEGNMIRVETTRSVYHTRKLIISAGAWTRQLIPQTVLPLQVTRQVIAWVVPDQPEQYTPDRFPCWLAAGHEQPGAWYGFPYLAGEKFPGPSGMKLALHHPGDPTDPDQVNREISEKEIRELLETARQYFVPAGFRFLEAKTCLYTNTPDEHFIIDHLPGYGAGVIIGSACSGHGFKFASVVGEILAELAIHGKTNLPVEFLRLHRFRSS